MPALKQINLGIIGVAGRGGSFRASVAAIDSMRLHAVCDLNEQGLNKAASELGVEHKYTDYEQMLDKAGVDAVIVGTPMPLHVPQAIAALKRDIHVISEVPASVSIEESRDLVKAANASKAVYMMAENYTYQKNNQVVKEMVRRGEFGKTYYAEGEYVHELKGLNEITKWRRKWQTGINGVTYGTHSLGPILQWMPGDRVEKVCCAGSGHNHVDPRGDKYENEASCVMLCKMASGGLVKIRVDMLSDRPHDMSYYHLQGMDGAYYADGRIWLRSRSDNPNQWRQISEFYDEFTPDNWVRFEELAKKAGHGGRDLLELIDFVDEIEGKRPCEIGIHQAMDMTLPGLVSQLSIANEGQWMDVPDSRKW